MKTKMDRQWRLVARPEGMIKESDFEWREAHLPSPSGGQVLIRNIYLSLDPTNRLWAKEEESYLPPVETGEVMRGVAIGVVEQSRNRDLPEGTLVQGLLGWQDYALADGPELTVIGKDDSTPLTAYFDVYGHIGITAYFGLLEIGKLVIFLDYPKTSFLKSRKTVSPSQSLPLIRLGPLFRRSPN